jgi:hypothetical protein
VRRQPNAGVSALSDQYVLEGDSLNMTIRVSDPDGDRVTIAATSKPFNAAFTDFGDGTARFAWAPDYVGPNSADGSPASVRFWASDGDLSSQMELVINVVNRNRRPEIAAPGSVIVEAGETLDFILSAFDPDFETVAWAWSGLPVGATVRRQPGSPDLGVGGDRHRLLRHEVRSVDLVWRTRPSDGFRSRGTFELSPIPCRLFRMKISPSTSCWTTSCQRPVSIS